MERTQGMGAASGDQLGISGYRSNWYNPDIVRKMVEKHILNPVLKEIQDQSYYEGNRREFGEFPTESGDTLILPARFYQTINDSSSHYSEVLAYSSNGNPPRSSF